MAENVNKEYAQIASETKLEYAPAFFKENGGIVIPKTEADFNVRGWFKVIDEKPSYDRFRYICRFVRWYREENKIKAEYELVEKPEPEDGGFEVSKMYLEIAIIKAGLYDKFIQILDRLEIPLDDEGKLTVKAKFLYDKALVLNTKNEMFLNFKPYIAQELGISEAQVDKILLSAKVM